MTGKKAHTPADVAEAINESAPFLITLVTAAAPEADYGPALSTAAGSRGYS
jgi:hypothetical protein